MQKYPPYKRPYLKIADLSNFNNICQKFILFGCYLYLDEYQVIVFINKSIHAKDNKAVTNQGTENFCFTINGHLKMLLRCFWYSHFPNFNMTFAKIFIRKLLFLIQIFERLLKFYFAIKSYDQESFDRKKSVLSTLCEI